MMLVGVVAYYTSDPGARSELAAPIVERLQAELAPLIFPNARADARLAAGQAGASAEPASAAARRASIVFRQTRFTDKSRGSGGVQ